MTEHLTRAGYEQTKDKLARLEERLARFSERTDLSPLHASDVRRSYE